MGTVSKLYVSNNTWIYVIVYVKKIDKISTPITTPRVSTPIPTPTPASLLNINSNSNSNSGSFNSNSNSGKSLEYQLQLQLQLRRFQLQFQLQLRSWSWSWTQLQLQLRSWPQPCVVLTESHENSVAEKSVANILLIGGSNCRDLQFKDDDQLDMRVTPLIQGGLLIEEASEKLDECTQTMRNDTDVVMVHVGSCNFPANDYADIDRHYTHYVELLNSISNSCPKASVIISSILPRNGHKNVNINEQVNELNKKLSELAWREDKIYFSDNNVHFGLGEGDIDRDLFKTTEKSGLHLNADGQNRLAKVMANAIKELHFKRKVEIQLEETQDWNIVYGN